MRTSTLIYLLFCVAAVTAESVYATSENPATQQLQGHALAWLMVVTVVFVLYRGATWDKYQRRD